MEKIYQNTLGEPVSFQGIGLHTGKKSKITILPNEADKGIVFKRIDLKSNNLVQANYQNVSSAKLCTTLQNKNGVKVSTVEHLLAALYITEIDNAIIEIDNEEVPIMDGSAKDFINGLKKIEIKELNKKRKFLKILKPIELKDGSRKISIKPKDFSLDVEFQLDYENKVIGKQKNQINFQSDDLERVYESRTFCLLSDIEKIKKIGLAKGGSLENALVVGNDSVLNKEGLRNEKEFVNHKILDLAGDFLLSGYRVLGKISCNQGGHELTNLFLRKLLRSNSSYIVSEIKSVIISKKIDTAHSAKIAVNA